VGNCKTCDEMKGRRSQRRLLNRCQYTTPPASSGQLARAVHVANAYRDPEAGRGRGSKPPAPRSSQQPAPSSNRQHAEGAEGARHRLRLRDLCASLALRPDETGMAAHWLPQICGLWHQPSSTARDGFSDRPRSRSQFHVALYSTTLPNQAAGKPSTTTQYPPPAFARHGRCTQGAHQRDQPVAAPWCSSCQWKPGGAP
jgi:hypothetical protein